MAKLRETFGAEELAVCLSRYDLGDVYSIEPFPRGSRQAPKMVIKCERGTYLFKRRPHGRDNPKKVAFTHRLQLHLAAQNFPLPHLIGTRKDNNSMLVHEGSIYEMFEYIEGSGYQGSREATYHAGHVLGLYHKLTADHNPEWVPNSGSYHDAKAIRKAIGNTIDSMPAEQRPGDEALQETVENLAKHYQQCAAGAIELGLSDWPVQMSHGDWHPGNMLFRAQHVVAVIDYDTARQAPRILDMANGALQFSILGGGDDPAKWPSQVDPSRFKKFLLGYDSANVISQAELAAVPYLICEAMIAEAVLPIAATGSFGRIEGFPFLQMIRRKVHWVLEHRQQLVELVSD